MSGNLDRLLALSESVIVNARVQAALREPDDMPVRERREMLLHLDEELSSQIYRFNKVPGIILFRKDGPLLFETGYEQYGAADLERLRTAALGSLQNMYWTTISNLRGLRAIAFARMVNSAARSMSPLGSRVEDGELLAAIRAAATRWAMSRRPWTRPPSGCACITATQAPRIETTKPLVVVTGPGPGSGKMATCLSQVYHDHRLGQRAMYAKFETFPIWSLPLKHPVNIAYEAATLDLKDFNLIDPFHLEATGEAAVNYNRDVESFPILKAILERITEDAGAYRSPTEMGVNRAGFAIVDDEACREARGGGGKERLGRDSRRGGSLLPSSSSPSRGSSARSCAAARCT